MKIYDIFMMASAMLCAIFGIDILSQAGAWRPQINDAGWSGVGRRSRFGRGVGYGNLAR